MEPRPAIPAEACPLRTCLLTCITGSCGSTQRTLRTRKRDRFVLSKGHTAPGLYAALAYRGFFPVEDLPTPGILTAICRATQHEHGSRRRYVHRQPWTGYFCCGGHGQGRKISASGRKCLHAFGDGEIAEGEVWEAMLFAAHYKLDNFCMVIDLNGLQIDGRTCDVMNTAPVDESKGLRLPDDLHRRPRL